MEHWRRVLPEGAIVDIAYEDLVADFSRSGPMGDDYKSALQELLQSRADPLPEYVVAAETGPAHRRMFQIELRVRGEIIAVADGRTKKEAEQEAARLGLQHYSR